MKTLGIFLFTLAILGVSIAQGQRESETPPHVTILKFGVQWKFKTISWINGSSPPSGGSTNSGGAGMGGGRDNPNLGREDREIQNRQQQADIEKSRQPGSTKSYPQPQAQGRDGYQYSISIKNTGNRTISAVEWMFIVTKTGSSEQPLEFTIYKKKKISPGKTRELSSVSDSGYYLTLAKPDKNTTPSFTTAVMIKRIEYSDGSIWERSSVMK